MNPQEALSFGIFLMSLVLWILGTILALASQSRSRHAGFYKDLAIGTLFFAGFFNILAAINVLVNS